MPHGRTLDHWHYRYKLTFLAALTEQVAVWLMEPVHIVVGGEIKVAATASDVLHPDAFRGTTHVSAAERDALTRLYGSGLVDIDAAVWGAHAAAPRGGATGSGTRATSGCVLDHLAVDRRLAARVDTTWIDHVERGAPRPSDHAALVADFTLAVPPVVRSKLRR